MGLQASYYAFAALCNRVKLYTMMFSSVSGMNYISPKSVTLWRVTDLGEKSGMPDTEENIIAYTISPKSVTLP